jgi:uncharacterized HAD superfamily protein
MKIGIDFDDVLAPSIIWFRRYLNEKHNKHIQKLYMDEIHKLEMSKDEFFEAWDNYCNTENTEILPLADSIEIIERLSKKHELYIISARSEYLKDSTMKWVNTHFPNLFKDVHLVNRTFRDQPVKKSTVCKQHKIHIMIDDSLENLIDCKDAGTKGIWFTQYLTSKNNDYKDKNIIIARSWLDVERQIEKYEKKGK